MPLTDKQMTSHLFNVPNQIDFVQTDKTDRYRFIHKFGANLNITTEVQDIQSNGGIYTWPTSNFLAEAVSDNANDFFGGPGAWSVFIEGLIRLPNGLLIEKNEEINLAGVSTRTGPELLFRINSSWVAKSGVYAGTDIPSHQGNVSIQTEGGGEIHTQILIDQVGFGQSLIARFTVPSNAFGYLQNVVACTDSIKPVRYYIFQRQVANIVDEPFTAKRIIYNSPPFEGQNLFSTENPIEIEPATDVWFAGVGTIGATNEITIDFELTLKYFDLDFSS